jgi:hypothetical protein
VREPGYGDAYWANLAGLAHWEVNMKEVNVHTGEVCSVTRMEFERLGKEWTCDWRIKEAKRGAYMSWCLHDWPLVYGSLAVEGLGLREVATKAVDKALSDALRLLG